MAPTPQQLAIAEKIDVFVVSALMRGGDEELLTTMADIMPHFGMLIMGEHRAHQAQMDALVDRLEGFRHFAELLTSIASGIADGSIEVPV